MLTKTLILLCTLAALIVLPLGSWIGWAHDQAEQWFEQYLNGRSEIFWTHGIWES